MTMTMRSLSSSTKRLSGPSNHPGFKSSGKTDSVDVVGFDREKDAGGIFSNYAEIPIKMSTPHGDRVFPTVEHYFQYQKDPGDLAYLNQILNGDAQNARNLGQTKKWQNFSLAEDAMSRALDEKLKNPQVRKALLATGNACLVEDTGGRGPKNQDGNWGWKQGGEVESFAQGGNKLGVLLMEKRNKLHQEENNPSMIVPDPRALSDRARGIMTRNYPNTNLIALSQTLPSASIAAGNQKSSKPTHQSSEPVSVMIRDMIQIPSAGSGLPLVSKGLNNGTLKIAFDNPVEANTFRNLLAKEGFETSYFNGKDKYPMQHDGKTLSHIVRFENNGVKTEIPAAALDFLKNKFDDDSKVSEIIEQMGFQKPEPRPGMRV